MKHFRVSHCLIHVLQLFVYFCKNRPSAKSLKPNKLSFLQHRTSELKYGMKTRYDGSGFN